MIVYGIVVDLNENRDLIFKSRLHTYYLKVPKSMYLKFEALLIEDQRCILKLKKDKQYFRLVDILKIYNVGAKKLIPTFHQNYLIDSVQSLIQNLDYTLFLDFEMSMHPYHYDPDFVSEIIQVGYVLKDSEGNTLKSYQAFIKPELFKDLTKRTLKFLSITQNDVNQGISFQAFYKNLKDILFKYRPAIMVWGSNDAQVLFQTLERMGLNQDIKLFRFIDLLKIHKQVLMKKDDIGLQTAYQMYGYEANGPQKHDALEDALMTSKVYQGFTQYLKGNRKLSFQSKIG